jgi:hypothetical protein
MTSVTHRLLWLALVPVGLSTPGCQREVDAVVDAAPVVPAAARLQPGRAYTWTVEWQTKALSRGDGTGSGLAGALNLRGELTFAAIEDTPEGMLVAAWLEDVDAAQIHAGHEVIDIDRGAMVGPRAYFVVDEVGDPTALRFAPGTPPVFRELMSGVIARVDLRGAAGVPAHARLGAGLGSVAYARTDDGVVHRSLTTLTRVDVVPGLAPDGIEVTARAELELDDAGVPRRIGAEDRAQIGVDGDFVADERFSLEQLRTADLEVTLPPVLEDARDPLDAPDVEAAERELAYQRAGSMTSQDVGIAMQTADGGVMPRAGFVSAASALVVADPEQIPQLEALAVGAAGYGRQLLFDVLAAGGTPEAQAAMVRLLESPEAAGWAEQGLLVQRFTFVHAPTPASARFLADHELDARERGDDYLARALLYPMGSVAGRVDDPWLAEQLHARLIERLDDPQLAVQRAALAGLGNLGRLEDKARIVGAQGSDDIDMRVEGVAALRKVPGEDVRAAVLAALDDPDEAVATRAIEVFADRFDTADDAIALAEHHRAGGVHPRVEQRVTEVLRVHAEALSGAGV